MKGVGEPYWEQDFPAGMDMLTEIMNCPRADERMEFEIFSRIHAVEPCA